MHFAKDRIGADISDFFQSLLILLLVSKFQLPDVHESMHGGFSAREGGLAGGLCDISCQKLR